MPYVDAEARDRLAHGGTPQNAGELNYSLSLDVDQYIEDKGLSYQTLNDISGVLTNLNLEVYRRITAAYEEIKIEANGDVFHKALALLKKAIDKAKALVKVPHHYDHSDMD